MSRLIDITNQRFSHLLVIARDGRKGQHVTWKCRCDCGQEIIALGCNLTTGHTRSCGCIKAAALRAANLTHGHGSSSNPTYRSWQNMRDRCENPHNKEYFRYGGRGIPVGERWQKFEHFLEDMGEKPEGLTLDRINNDLGYYKANCRWATRKEQANNRRIRGPDSYQRKRRWQKRPTLLPSST